MNLHKTGRLSVLIGLVFCGLVGFALLLADHGDLPNRIPEPAPYNTAEAQYYPPPYESDWNGVNNPGSCDGCHSAIFDQWNGSMMSNSWRDPGWRAAFLLVARLTSTDGNCDTPNPPDGSTRAEINPFADGVNCTSTYDLGTTTHTTDGSGSLLDDFCSRCHMPTNYMDNIPLANVTTDQPSGQEHGLVDSNYDPTSDNGTGLAYATLASQFRNTESGQRGIFCEVCHTMAETRLTPYHNYEKSGTEYYEALGTNSRGNLLPPAMQDMLAVADNTSPNLGYGVGAGGFRISPHAIGFPERFGPLSANDFTAIQDPYVSDVFDINYFYQQGDFSGKHDGFFHAYFERSEMCASCHDVSNPLTMQNSEGRWVGGFPIERTYSEWAGSRYADRPGNSNYDTNFKRDCQTCHMQQDLGQAGTAQTLFDGSGPVAPLSGQACRSGPVRPAFYSHYFIGGNAYVTNMIGADIDTGGNVEPYPELSTFSFSSADENSIYHNAYWENVSDKGPPTQHARLAWDRLRNVLDLDITGAAQASAGTSQSISIDVVNSGCGHNFPTGFPEGRNAWVSVRAFDLDTGDELDIHDSFWNRTATGVGYLTQADMIDPNFAGCNWTVPAGTADPYSHQFKAVASLGDNCPTLALPYATPLNMVVNANNEPVDSSNVVIDRDNPLGLPQYTDLDGDGDVYDDAFLIDTRLRPLPHADAVVVLDRYSVVIPAGTVGPVAVTAAVYYQSFEAIVAEKFLGNMADTDLDFHLEPCVLNGSCDGRTPTSEPAVVEGAPPVPMEVVSHVINITGNSDTSVPTATTYPLNGAVDTYLDLVPKVTFNEPMIGLDNTTVTLVDSNGLTVPIFVDQISDGTWAIFPHQVFLDTTEVYTARVAAGVCDFNNNCTTSDIVWSFETARKTEDGTGDTSVLLGFGGGGSGTATAPTVTSVVPSDGQNNVDRNTTVVVTFSEPVTGVDATSFLVNTGDCSSPGSAVSGTVSGNVAGDVWTFTPAATLGSRADYCVTITTAVIDLNDSLNLASPFNSTFKTRKN